jgi:putative sigma-54 modulation protein
MREDPEIADLPSGPSSTFTNADTPMAFQTQITTRHVNVSDQVRQYAEERTAKLEQFFDNIIDAHVILGEDNSPASNKTAEININVYQKQLSAEDSASTHQEAINLCVDHLRRQLEKYKAKLRSKDKDAHR